MSTPPPQKKYKDKKTVCKKQKNFYFNCHHLEYRDWSLSGKRKKFNKSRIGMRLV